MGKTVSERLREVRDRERLSRAAFGARLGVSGDVINNLERGRVEVKDSMIKLICTEFQISEEWLKSGNGDMTAAKDLLDQVKNKYDLTPSDMALIRQFIDLSPANRNIILEYMHSVVEDMEKQKAVQLHADLDQEIELQEAPEAKSTGSDSMQA